MFGKKFWYKKTYRGTWRDVCFMGVLSITIILETNLISHTLSISNILLKVLGVSVLTVLVLFIQVRADILATEVEEGKREIVSFASSKYLSVVKRFTIVSVLPLFITIFTKKENEQLFGIIGSVILVILFKSYLDLIVTFSTKGYSSGFEDIQIESNMRVEIKQEKTHAVIGNFITFELYDGDKCKGYDKFTEEDYMVLKKNIIMKGK